MHQGNLFFFPVPISENRIKLFSMAALKMIGFLFCFLEFFYNLALFGIYFLKDHSLLTYLVSELIVSLGVALCSWVLITLLTFCLFGKKSSFCEHCSICLTIHVFLLFLQLVYLRFMLYEDSLPTVYIINDLFLNGIACTTGLLLSSSEFGAYLLATKRRHSIKIQALFIMSGYFFVMAFIFLNIVCTPVVLYFETETFDAYYYFGTAAFIFLFLVFLELFLRRKEFSRKKYNKIAQLDEEYI